MTRKNKTFLLFTTLAAATMVCAIGVANMKFAEFFPVRGDNNPNNPYILNLNRSVTSAEISAGQATFNTSGGNSINFNFDSEKASIDNGLISLATGGYFYNDTKITGITSVEAVLGSGSATLSYGNAKNVYNVGSATLSGTSPIYVSFDEPSDYFKIDNISGPLNISSLKITYSCSNTYEYATDKEIASKDLLYSSELTNNMSSNYYTLDSRCFETVNENSGYSFHIVTTESANDWPNFILNLTSSVSLKSIVVSVKAREVTKFSIMPLDENGNNLLTWNLVTTTVTENWQTLEFTPTSGQIAAGKDLTSVSKLKFIFDFNTAPGGPGKVREFWFDELHINEAATQNGASAYNLEMCNYMSDQYWGYGSEAETTYVDTNNSYSARKITFKNNTAYMPGKIYVCFNLNTTGFGVTNGIDAKNSVLTFDLKLSQEFYDSNNSNWACRVYDGRSNPAYIEKDWLVLPNYATGNPNKWLNVNVDLSTISAFADLAENTTALTLEFRTINSTTKDTAYLVIDNLALTAK